MEFGDRLILVQGFYMANNGVLRLEEIVSIITNLKFLLIKAIKDREKENIMHLNIYSTKNVMILYL